MPGGIVLGADISKGKYWTVDDDTHVLLIGTTRSGKSRRVIMPTIWHLANSGESMVVCDLKKELQPITKEYLKKQGYNIITLDFRNPATGNQWNLLHPVIRALEQNNTALAIDYANDIANALANDSVFMTDKVWSLGKKALIAALVLAVADKAPPTHKHMTTVFYLLAYLGEDGGEGLDNYLKSFPLSHPARISYATYAMSRDKMRSSFSTDTLASIQIFGTDPLITWMMLSQDHDLAIAGKEKTAIFLIIPDERTNRNFLATLYIQQSYSALVDLANQNRGRLPVRVNFLLDEFGNIPAITDFTTKITTAGGRGIRFTIAVQGIDQIAKLYPKEENTIMGQCWTWIYILTSDVKTAELISKKCGNYTVTTESYNSSAQLRGGRSEGVSQGLMSRELITTDEVQRWPVDSVLILRTRLHPARLPLPDISRWPIASSLDLKRKDDPDPVCKIKIPDPWLPDGYFTERKTTSKVSKEREDDHSIGDIFGFN